ncbi:MAG: hypothetical protein GYA55_09050 [SAR324 cluster bacterium]|uniref:Uncharacterized protein n=1 Tax=SAR324 cluster bacterium TaxID=2024889 RepID=A0A7X9FSH1_9DELT|nr:hypothetical protein [SAR324 cluster bacterium]
MSEKEFFDKDFVDEDWLSTPRRQEGEVDRRSVTTDPNKSRRKNRHPLLISLLICVGVILISIFSFKKSNFPILQIGFYTGKIESLNGNSIPLFAMRDKAGRKMLIWPLEKGWKASIVPVDVPAGSEEKSIDAISIKRQGEEFLLSGNESSKGRYEGAVGSSSKKAVGHWTLHLLDSNLIRTYENTETSDINWLALKTELDEIEAKLALSEKRIPEQQKEIEKLMSYIDEKESLKANAEKKYNDEKMRAEKLKEALVQKQSEMERLEQKVRLAYKVTEMGKLVSLARESLEKDKAWIQIMLGHNVETETPEFQEAYNKAKRIVTLKRQLAEEQERIYALLHPGEMKNSVEQTEAQ